MKNLTIIIIFLLSSVSAFADASSARQTVQLNLMPVIEFSANKQGTSVDNKTQNLNIKSNKGYTVSVSTVTVNNVAVNATALANSSKNGEQTLAVNYKAKSNALVVYTATQP